MSAAKIATARDALAAGVARKERCRCCGDADAAPRRTMCALCLEANCLVGRWCDRIYE